MQNIWFTSDTHFGHAKIIPHCDRPFLSVDDMDEVLIQNWNSCVKSNDVIYHLGDFSFRGAPQTIEILKRLNGQKFLIKGNHDKGLIKKKTILAFFIKAEWYHEIYVLNKQKIVLSHFPFLSWNKMHKGSWHLHGHCHNSLKTTINRRIDVGIDCNNMYPFSLDQIESIMSTRGFEYVDHHK